MKTVSVSELKAHLSRYLRDVRRGSEIQVLDRGVPVARLMRPAAPTTGDDEARRQRLAAAGILRTGSGRVKELLKTPPLKLPTSLVAALLDDRADRL